MFGPRQLTGLMAVAVAAATASAAAVNPNPVLQTAHHGHRHQAQRLQQQQRCQQPQPQQQPQQQASSSRQQQAGASGGEVPQRRVQAADCARTRKRVRPAPTDPAQLDALLACGDDAVRFPSQLCYRIRWPHVVLPLALALAVPARMSKHGIPTHALLPRRNCHT